MLCIIEALLYRASGACQQEENGRTLTCFVNGLPIISNWQTVRSANKHFLLFYLYSSILSIHDEHLISFSHGHSLYIYATVAIMDATPWSDDMNPLSRPLTPYCVADLTLMYFSSTLQPWGNPASWAHIGRVQLISIWQQHSKKDLCDSKNSLL